MNGRDTAGWVNQSHTASPELVSGFGTMLRSERELRLLLQDGMAQERIAGADALLPLLAQQLRSVDSIISLLRRRQQRLPFPARFTDPRLQAAAWPAGPDAPTGTTSLISDLLRRHQVLLYGLESLAGVGGPRLGSKESLLWEAIGHHDRMAAQLAGLIHGLPRAPAPAALQAQSWVPRGRWRLAVRRWHRNGGTRGLPFLAAIGVLTLLLYLAGWWEGRPMTGTLYGVVVVLAFAVLWPRISSRP